MDIFAILYENSNEENAEPMAKYMKDLFPFLGIKKPARETLTKGFISEKKKEIGIDWDFIFKSYDLPEREFQYLAIDYMIAVKDRFVPADMEKVEKLITTKSWWDTVDAINIVVGHIALKYQEVKKDFIAKWMRSDNIWLKRISIIFQLKYKVKTDTEFLREAILQNANTGEYFVDKAIGWALREYSKTNKEWVREFIESNELSKLSVREGSKYI